LSVIHRVKFHHMFINYFFGDSILGKCSHPISSRLKITLSASFPEDLELNRDFNGDDYEYEDEAKLVIFPDHFEIPLPNIEELPALVSECVLMRPVCPACQRPDLQFQFQCLLVKHHIITFYIRLQMTDTYSHCSSFSLCAVMSCVVAVIQIILLYTKICLTLK